MPQKSGTITVSVRAPAGVIAQIDALITAGLYRSRSNFFEHCAARCLAEQVDDFEARFIQALDHPDVKTALLGSFLLAFDQPEVKAVLFNHLLRAFTRPDVAQVIKQMNIEVVREVFSELLSRDTRTHGDRHE